MIRSFLFIVLTISSSVVYAGKRLDLQPSSQLSARISLLLEAVSQSGCTFIRNGKSHTSSEGMKHIKKKYAHYENDIDSIDTFIELTATRSLISGRAYEVQCNGQTMTSADWLSDKASTLGNL